MKGETSTVSVNKFDLENFVQEATWKDILVELVRKNELNPWDIDIVDLVGRYIDVVKSLKILDLRIPANIILAAAILLRLKSDMLEIEEHAEEVEAGAEEFVRPYVPVDGLSVRLRLAPKSRVSLNELISALEDAMKLKEVKEAQAATETKFVPMVFDHADVEVEVEKVYALVKKNVDNSKMVTYSTLCDVSKSENSILSVFVPLLFLACKDKVLLLQETFFGEIIVSLN
jgi:segregation and condensation protein A